MADEKAAPASEPKTWVDWATRTTAILAVLAALSSGQWGSSNLKAILAQGIVNDDWGYYQAKSIKEHTAEEIALLARATGGANPSPEVKALIEKLETEAVHQKEDKLKVESEAHAEEATRDKTVERSFWFECAFACLQVGVILCTIAAAAKKKGLWAASLAFGFGGLILVANGFLNFIPTPDAAHKLAPKLESKAPVKPSPEASGK